MAAMHNNEMIRTNQFTHNGLVTGDLEARANTIHWSTWKKLGENLGKGGGSCDSLVDIIWNAWLNSPLHFANLIDPNWNAIGFSTGQDGSPGNCLCTVNFGKVDLANDAFIAPSGSIGSPSNGAGSSGSGYMIFIEYNAFLC